MLNYYENRKQGVGLLEILLVLVMVALIIVMATRYYQQAQDDLKVTQAIQKIRKITEASFDWVKGQNDFTGLTNDSLKSYLTDYDFVSPWGGIIQISSNPAANRVIVITLFNATEVACKNINDMLVKEDFLRQQGLPCTFRYPASIVSQ